MRRCRLAPSGGGEPLRLCRTPRRIGRARAADQDTPPRFALRRLSSRSDGRSGRRLYLLGIHALHAEPGCGLLLPQAPSDRRLPRRCGRGSEAAAPPRDGRFRRDVPPRRRLPRAGPFVPRGLQGPDGCRPFDGCRSRAPRRPGHDARHRADAPCGNGQFPDGSRGGPHLPCGVPHPFGRREALRPPRAECRGVRAATRGTGRIHRGERADGRILARTAAAGGALPGQPLLRRRLGTGIAFPQFRSAGGRGAMAVAGRGGQRPFRTAAVQ